MFKLMGDDPSTAAAEAKSVMDAETALATASKKREDLRDRVIKLAGSHDLQRTTDENAKQGIAITIRPAPDAQPPAANRPTPFRW